MSDCWLVDGDLRPSFSELVNVLLMHMDVQVLDSSRLIRG